MREILFKGKRKDNGEWVSGILVPSKIPVILVQKLSNNNYGDPEIILCRYEVIPETVGQYILTDKNGKKVFDGDIIKNQYEKNKYQYFKVFYCDRTYCYLVENKYGMLGNLSNVIGEIEVIGNIHDNPELLQVGE